MRLALTIALALVSPGLAAADPTTDRVFTAPTAWLPPEGGVVAAGSLDLREIADARGEGGLHAGYGLGGFAAVELGMDTDVRGCTQCEDERPEALYLGRASFRIGARQDAWFPGMPALLVGVRSTFAASGSFRDVRAVDGYVVASRVLGPVRVHAGVTVLDAGFLDAGTEIELGPKARPLLGLEWTPAQYPKTSVMGDVAYAPRLERAASGSRVALEWIGGWGVRYQAFAWGAIELAVRHRQDEGLGDSTVMVRLNGVWNPTRPGKPVTTRDEDSK